MPQINPGFVSDPHQLVVEEFVLSRPGGGAAAWMEPGTGKSFVGTKVLIDWLNNGLARAMITCPARLIEDWRQKLDLYAGIPSMTWDEFVKAGKPAGIIPLVSHNQFQIPAKGKKKKAKAPQPTGIFIGRMRIPLHKIFDVLLAKRWSNKSIKLLEAHGLRVTDAHPKAPPRRANVVPDFIAWKPQIIINDEAHRFKGYKTAQTRGLLKLVDATKPERRLALTGTPTTTCDPEELRPQLLFVDAAYMKRSGYDNWARFRGAFCEIEYQSFGDDQREKVSGTRNQSKLDALMAPLAIKVKNDVLGLEEPHFEDLYYRISSRGAKLYKQMASSGSILSKDLEVTTENPLGRAGKLAEIRSGFVRDFEGVIHDIDSELIDTVMDRVQDAQLPILLIYNFTHTGDRLLAACRKAGYRVDIIRGGVDSKTSLDIEKRFQAGKLDIVIGQWQAISLGLTFTASCHMKCVEPTNLLEAWDQTLLRILRRGQTRKCSYELYNEPSSLDTQNYKALKAKQDFAAMVTKGLVRL